MPTRNVNLTDHWQEFVEASVQSGRFSNASEVVREGLRLLERREAEEQARLEWLRRATGDALASIEARSGMTFDSVDEMTNFIQTRGPKVRARARRA